MPEGPEVDTDKLREAIDEEIEKEEKESGNLLRTIALTTAVLAALAAIASLEAGATVNEALALKTEATQLQAKASDQWAYYQAKGIKATIADVARQSLTALEKPIPDELTKNKDRYAEEQKASKEKAEEFEKQLEEKNKESESLMTKHHYFAQSVALLQVSIALGAVAALTRRKPVWIGSTLLGLAGALIFGYAFMLH
jgi:hypothetical protein